MRLWVVALFTVAVSVSSPSAQTNSAKTPDIYVVDVEGGNATLFCIAGGRVVADRFRKRGSRGRTRESVQLSGGLTLRGIPPPVPTRKSICRPIGTSRAAI